MENDCLQKLASVLSSLPLSAIHLKFIIFARSKRIWNYTLLSRHIKCLLFCDLSPACSLAFLWNTMTISSHSELMLIRVLVFSYCRSSPLAFLQALGCHFRARVGGRGWTDLYITGPGTDNIFFMVVTQ